MEHCEKVKRKRNPREKANFLSLLTFTYTGKLFRKAFKKDLQEDDIYDVVKVCGSKRCGDVMQNEWLKLKKNGKSSIVKLIWNCFGTRYIMLGMIHLIWKLSTSYIEPESLSKLISYFNKPTTLTVNDAYFYAGLIIGTKLLHSFYFQNYIIYLQHLAIQIRCSFCSLIYRKSLRLTPAAMNDISLGNIITVMTKDVLTFEHSIWLLNDMWIEIIRTILVSYLIYNKIGVVSFTGIGMLLALVPLQIYIGKLLKNMRLKINKHTDERLQATQETLSAIKIIKMYTWERLFAERVSAKRSKEMGLLMKSSYLKSLSFLGGILSSKIGFYVLIMSYIWVNNVTSAEVIFYVMKCFKDLKHSITMLIPFGTDRGAELVAAVTRINKVLNAAELAEDEKANVEKPKINIRNASVTVKDKEVLKDININLRKGLTAVTGPLGCGKSALLKLFLKDYPLKEGQIVTEGVISYSSQDPWLFPSSIKQNILFGEVYNEKRYKEVVRVCALQYDFDIFEHGDETIVADRGLNLSKGQQARVNLARAVYKKSDIYLLDDPLNALDPSVQDYVFTNCIVDFLKGEIVVLITHNQKHIRSADNLVLLENGKIKYDGKQNETPVELLNAIETKQDANVGKEDEKEEKDSDEKDALLKKPLIERRKVYSEVKKEGKVGWDVYRGYFLFGGGYLMFFLIFLLFAVAEFAESYSSKLLTNWINLEQNLTNSKHIENITDIKHEAIESQARFTLNLYSGMLVGGVIIDLVRQYLFLYFARNASINTHNAMINTIVTSGMTFFDHYFIGNILNRFSQDLGVLDEHLPNTINMFVHVIFSAGGMVLLVATVNWTFLVPSTAFVFLLVLLRIIYMPTARSLKRLEAATRSPLIGHLNASMEGVTTVRAYKAQRILEEEFDRHQDLYTSAHYMSFCTRRAFGLFMDLFSVCFLSIIIGKLLFFDTGELAGNVGLAITKAAGVAGVVQFALMQWSDLETNMTSVERVLEYTDLPQDNYAGNISKNWPSQGAVKYINVTMSYSNEKVLKNVSFEVEPKQKIGIVGRTGAGKSSIISTLFRLYNFDGTIMIDGVNTKTVSLDFLRKHISIIPQDPVVFQGTVRSNLDPYNEYSDEEIWQAIEKAELREAISSLDLEITDHGSNFSTGQRQLLCLARAIIRKNKIVVLDEATANMDPATENLIHKAIVDNFNTCTVFIIAHRLQSVVDCNKIMVMEKGEIVEFDDPVVLMENKNSFFSKMAKNSDAFEK